MGPGGWICHFFFIQEEKEVLQTLGSSSRMTATRLTVT